MPKSKKNKKKDFQKVKLKVGRKLPKADNETQTSFKSARIEIPNQLKGDSSQPTTKRKLNFNDLSSQLHHYSSSVRVGAVNGLRELFTSSPEVIHENMALVLEKSSALFHDKDNLVREASIRLQRVILPQISASQMSPFFSLISAHLCCAMSHIQDDVQMDSLSMLDLYLELFPDFVVGQTMQILPIFIEQISRQSLNKTKSSRSLFVNPNSKLSTQKWRTKVLSRLMKILSAVIKGKARAGVNDNIDNNLPCVKWNAEHPTYIQLFSAQARQSWRTTGYRISSIIGGPAGTETATSGGPSQSYITTLMPVMMECWLECLPERNTDKGCIVHPDALSMMSNVLGVVQLLWQWISYDDDDADQSLAEWFHKDYFKECRKHFMGNFPYSVKVTSSFSAKKKNSDAQKSQDTSVLSVNLAVCDVISRFLQHDTQQSNHKCLKPITGYLLDAMDAGELSTENLTTVLHVVKSLLPLLHQQEDIVGKLLASVWQMYAQAHPLSQHKRTLLEWFSELALHRKWHTLQRQNVVKQFPRTLPKLLCEMKRSSSSAELDRLIIQVIHKACCQGDTTLLQPYLEDILDSNSGLLVTVSVDNQKDVIDLLYYTRHLDESHLKSLKSLLRDSRLSKDNVEYLLNILFTRWQEGELRSDLKSEFCSPAPFISFLSSVALGISAADLEHLRCPGGYKFFKPSTGDWKVQQHLTQHIVSLIQQSTYSDQMSEIVLKCLDDLLLDVSQMSYPCLLSVLTIFNGFYSEWLGHVDQPMEIENIVDDTVTPTDDQAILGDLAPAVIKICVTALYDLVSWEIAECALEEIPDTDYQDMLWHEICVISCSQWDGMIRICELIASYLISKDVPDKDVPLVVKGLSKLLRRLISPPAGHISPELDTSLHQIILSIQDNYPRIISDDERSWEEFKYYISLIKDELGK